MVGSVHQHRKCRQKSNDKGNFGNSLGKKNRKRILFDTVGAVVMRLLIVLPASSSPFWLGCSFFFWFRRLDICLSPTTFGDMWVAIRKQGR